MKDVIVVGGGIIGLSTAFYLQKAGHRVTIVDKNEVDAGASFVNAGYVTPSHMVPLAAPGVIWQGIKWMFNPESPFYIKPRLDPELISWMWKFYRSSNANAVEKAIPLLLDLNLKSRELYLEIRDSHELEPFPMERKGLFMLYQNEKEGEHEWMVGQKAKSLGLDVRQLSMAQVKEMEPDVAINALGAVYYESDAHSTPVIIMGTLKKYLVEKGVKFVLGSEVLDASFLKGKLNGLLLQNGTKLNADHYVFCGGAESPLLLRKLGVKISMQAGKGYALDTKSPTALRYPHILMEARVAITPMEGFTRFAGTMELSGINHKIVNTRVNAIAKAANKYFPEMHLQFKEAQCGLRPVSPDGLPYIGITKQHKNLLVATGHAMMGWSLGPITGKLIQELVDGQKASVNLNALHPERWA